jgi:hypothetical protein
MKLKKISKKKNTIVIDKNKKKEKKIKKVLSFELGRPRHVGLEQLT